MLESATHHIQEFLKMGYDPLVGGKEREKIEHADIASWGIQISLEDRA